MSLVSKKIDKKKRIIRIVEAPEDPSSVETSSSQSSEKLEEEAEDLAQPIADTSNVYLLRMQGSQEYKIGWSSELTKMLAALNSCTGSSTLDSIPVFELVACGPGGESVVRELYRAYATCSIRQKWFVFDDTKLSEVLTKYKLLRYESERRETEKFNERKETLYQVYDTPRVTKTGSCFEVSIINDARPPDLYSKPVIEKVHKVGKKYIAAILSTLTAYYQVTSEPEDVVLYQDFCLLLNKQLPRTNIDCLPELVGMVIAKLNNYICTSSITPPSSIRFCKYSFPVLPFLKVKLNLISPLARFIGNRGPIQAFTERYGRPLTKEGVIASGEAIEIQDVDEVVDYLSSNPFLVRSSLPEFSYHSLGLKHLIEHELPSCYCSNGEVILACFILGCAIHSFGGADDPNCMLGITMDTSRENKHLFSLGNEF